MGLFLVCMYVAVLLVRPQEWYAAVAGYELVNIIALPTILFAFIEQTQTKTNNFILRSRLSQAMLGLLVSVMLSQLARFRVHGAFDAVTEFGKVTILFYLVAILVNTPHRLRVMMLVIIACAVLLSYHSYLQVNTGHGFGDIEPFGSFDTGDFRVMGSGILGDPNDFAMLYVMAIPFVFCLLSAAPTLISKIVLLFTLPPMVYVIYYTQSRGGVFGFCAMFMAYFWNTTKRPLVRVLALVVLLSTIVLIGPERARGTYVEGSASGRITAWGLGIQMVKESPLFGVGYSRWPDYTDGLAAHNSVVNCLGELGLIGYFFWFTLCLLVGKALFRIAGAVGQIDVRTRRVANGLFAAQVGYLTSAFFLTRTYNPVLFFYSAWEWA
jgi:putative inorganic carbon (hco3(-)) transporter